MCLCCGSEGEGKRGEDRRRDCRSQLCYQTPYLASEVLQGMLQPLPCQHPTLQLSSKDVLLLSSYPNSAGTTETLKTFWQTFAPALCVCVLRSFFAPSHLVQLLPFQLQPCLQCFAYSKTGNQPWKLGWKCREGSGYQHSTRTPTSSELIREACTEVFHLDQGSYHMPPAWSSLPFICRSGQGRTKVFPNYVTSHCTLDISTTIDNLVAGSHWDAYYPI